MEESEGYDLAKSKKSVHELYPVIKDAHGNVIDGFHRLEADLNWKTETLEQIKTPAQLALARIIANTHRRSISKEERKLQLVTLAEELVKEGLSKDNVIMTIVDLTTFSEQYVRKMLPDIYKQRPGVGGGSVKLSFTQDHEHVYDAGSTHCRICGRELTAPESVAAGIGPVCASGTKASPEELEEEFNGIAGRLGIVNAPEEPRYKASEEEIFAFLNRFKYQKDVDGILLDNMIGLFGLSASQALDWLEKWREARAKSNKLTPEEKIFLEEYERTHPREDDPIKKLVKYYPPELMDTVFTRLRSDNFETVLKYCRRYVQELHDRASDELRKAVLEAIRW
jgi:hypothetical protein